MLIRLPYDRWHFMEKFFYFFFYKRTRVSRDQIFPNVKNCSTTILLFYYFRLILEEKSV